MTTTLNPEIFRWARSTAGLSADEAARALGFNNTRDRSAAECLKALEAGDEEPSRSVLLRMAKAYRPLVAGFFTCQNRHEPVIEGKISALFRVRRRCFSIQTSMHLSAMYADDKPLSGLCWKRQSRSRSTLSTRH